MAPMRILLMFTSLCVFPLLGQSALGVASKTDTTVAGASIVEMATVVTPDSLERVNQIAELQNENEKIRFDLIASVNRLTNLESSITEASERAETTSIRSSLLAFLTVTLSVAVGLLGQYFLIRHQRGLSQQQERAKVSNSYIEWQLKQLSELYGPLRALLGQSIAIYRQMNMCLIAADEKKFRLSSKPGADFDDVEFQTFLSGTWVQFRTVEHLPLVYNKNYGVEPYFDDVVRAGAAIADVIRKSAGYVRQEDAELIKIMGIYLAHYGVLCRLHERALKGEETYPTSADLNASFPRIIHELVDKGFNAINTQIMNWKNFQPAKEF